MYIYLTLIYKPFYYVSWKIYFNRILIRTDFDLWKSENIFQIFKTLVNEETAKTPNHSFWMSECNWKGVNNVGNSLFGEIQNINSKTTGIIGKLNRI